MPDDQLQWRAWIIPNLENNESAAVLKVHHAVGDGIAILVMLGTLVDEYSPTQWIQTTSPLSKCSKILITLLKPFTMTYAFLFFLFWSTDRNYIKNSVNLAGVKKNAISKRLDISELKMLGSAN